MLNVVHPETMSELVPANDIHTAAVLGAGTMGHGIAQVLAMAGIEVRLRDLNEGAVQAGLNRIRGNLEKGVAAAVEGGARSDERAAS